MAFECSFQSFSYKSFANISQKGGALAPWAPPLNPPLKKSTATSVRQFRCWFEEKQHKELELPLEIHKMTKKEAPQLLKHFILKTWETSKENKGKEYEPGSSQTRRNGL